MQMALRVNVRRPLFSARINPNLAADWGELPKYLVNGGNIPPTYHIFSLARGELRHHAGSFAYIHTYSTLMLTE